MPGASDTEPTQAVDDGAALAALERVLSSEGFRGAPQLVAFLRFIVERTLDGRSGELKGYTIATEALGRQPDFDPQTDPIVRVEAGRLRRALAHYYATDGARDPARITVPLGAYVPQFEAIVVSPDEPFLRSDSHSAADVPARPGATASASTVSPRRPAVAGIGLVVLLTAMMVLYAAWNLRGPPLPAASPVVGVTADNAPVNLPVVSLISGASISDLALAELTRVFSRHLVDALARFDDRVIVKTPNPGEVPGAGADYIFEMTAARVGDDVEGLGSLRAASNGRIVWTSSVQRAFTQGATDPELGEIARRLAARLADSSGIIHADFRTVTSSQAMRCLDTAYAYRRSMTREHHLAARTCLEAVVANEPRFHPAWSQLALILVDEYAFGFNPGEGSALERALTAASTAIQLAPASARAQEALMRVHFARGSVDDALRLGQDAVARNPVDPDVLADLGARYVQLNRPAEGLPLLERAIDLRQGRSAAYDFYAYVGAFLLGADSVAEGRFGALALDDGPYGALATALGYARRGERAGTVSALRRLGKLLPGFAADPPGVLRRLGFGAAVADRILSGIGPAALSEIGN